MDTPTQPSPITYEFTVHQKIWYGLQREFVTLRGPPAGEVIAAHIEAMFCNWAGASGVTILDIEVSKNVPDRMVEIVGHDGGSYMRAALGGWPFTISFGSMAHAEAFCVEFSRMLSAGEGAS